MKDLGEVMGQMRLDRANRACSVAAAREEAVREDMKARDEDVKALRKRLWWLPGVERVSDEELRKELEQAYGDVRVLLPARVGRH